MGWLLAIGLVSVVLLIAGIAGWACHHARVEHLQAVIRGQRWWIDQLETDLCFPSQKRRQAARRGGPNRGLDLGLDRRRGYRIEPSAN